MFDTTRRKDHKIFFNGNFAFFSEIFDSNNLSGLKKRSYRFHSKCENGFWTPTICFLSFATLDKTKKNGPKSFVNVKICFLNCLFLSTS